MLQRKVKKAVAPYDDAVVGGLRELSEFYGPNTAAARRGLRGAIERRGLAINRELLGAFEPLLRELDAVDAEADSLSDACASIATRLREARASTEVLLAATARLREDSRLNERRQELCELFEREFMLSDAEEAVLNAPADAEVELEPLLAALRRSQEVHGRASARLLGTQFQPLGLEVMERMAAHEERAYASLYRWVHAQCSQLQPDDAASVARLSVSVESLLGQLLSYALHEMESGELPRVVERPIVSHVNREFYPQFSQLRFLLVHLPDVGAHRSQAVLRRRAVWALEVAVLILLVCVESRACALCSVAPLLLDVLLLPLASTA